MDGRRRGREDYEELDRLLEEADRSLVDGGELREANEALKRAGVKAASMWGGVGVRFCRGTRGGWTP